MKGPQNAMERPAIHHETTADDLESAGCMELEKEQRHSEALKKTRNTQFRYQKRQGTQISGTGFGEKRSDGTLSISQQELNASLRFVSEARGCAPGLRFRPV
jgi:hypothetical protein